MSTVRVAPESAPRQHTGRLRAELPTVTAQDTLRTGGCTEGCGACCEKIIIPLDPRLRTHPQKFNDWVKWAELHGLIIIDDPEKGRLDAFMYIECEALTPDKECNLMGTSERPDLCAGFPARPDELESIRNVCSYEFIDLTEVRHGAPN
ncbi:hypothetical protein LCGC14_0581700 [marine sediment metagenome]|uniref:Zinc/iron-chelating domain-containing protein n=1 Tax=marine sediment metagenome TaxID=412755 RepID=A0A0F9RG76_9ZZZZ